MPSLSILPPCTLPALLSPSSRRSAVCRALLRHQMTLLRRTTAPLLLFTALILTTIGHWATVSAAEATPIAHATLVAGAAWRITPEGTRHRLQENAPLYPGDTVETQSGALLHLTFIDNARLAVKPETRLTIRHYETAPGTERIELLLKRGAIRQLTGEAAHRAPQRYRLATPIAAIGVRGTDFAVKTSQRETQTLLFAGAIVAAPLALCSETHACAAAVEITPAQPAWRITAEGAIQPLTPAELNSLRPELSRAPAAPASTATANTPAENVTEALAIATPAAPPAPSDNLPAERLVWGRWFAATDPTLAAPLYAELQAAGLAPVVANARYVLMRETAADATLAPTLTGTAKMNLTTATATLTRGLWSEPAQLGNAHLTLDFTNRRFDTAATLSHPAVGAHTVAASGELTANGLFGAATSTDRVLGAVTTDGRTAGVLFERQLPNATRLEGLTTWQR